MTSVRRLLLVPIRHVASAAILVGIASTPAFAQAAPGLVAAYAFDEGAGTVVSDSSGTGNTGTAANATWTTAGRFGQAIVLNGTTSLITVPDSASLRLTSAMTLEAWVKPSVVSAAWTDVIYKGDDNYYLESATPSSSRPAIGALYGSTHVETFGTAALTVNVWAHLAATYDGTTIRLYVNGTQVATTARTGNITTSTNPLQIGGDSLYGQFFAGAIDDVRIYNRALTGVEVQTDMNTPVAGGGVPSPDLTLTKTHVGNFTPGQAGATYTVTVTNSGSGTTSGLVMVVDALPAGLTATGVSGTGWSCTLASPTCTRSDALAAGANYPVVTVTVTVASTAPASVTNTATVSGGGDANGANNSASDPTTITAASSGLVAAYAFSEGTGATLADVSGNGHSGAITNATWTTGGKYGNALVFNGTTSRVTIADTAALHLSTGMTLEAWVRPSVAPNGWVDIIYKGDDIYFLEASGNTGTPVAAGTFGTALAQANAPTALSVNTWTHLAATYDGTAVRLYVNGVQAASTARTGTLASSTSPLELGGDLFYGQVFNGAIDEVRIYNVALSAAQIQTDMNTPVAGGVPSPDLTIAKTHVGAFTQGQIGATYTLIVTNSGTAATSGSVTVTETVPAGLTATGLSGTGWACTQPAGPCTRSDVLAAGAGYPALSLAVNVASTAPASVTNTANVSGGGETNTGNNSATDITTINVAGVPDLRLTKTHAGTFTQGQTGATYTLIVTNSGTAATSGSVTVTETVPAGLTATGLSGTGWACTQPAGPCTRSDVLAAGAGYPALSLAVNVASTAPASVTNTANVSGGGETNTGNNSATDITAINVAGVPDLLLTKTHTGTFTQGQAGTYTLSVTNTGTAATAGLVTVTEAVPTGLTATGLSGTGWACTQPAGPCTRSDALAAGAGYPALSLSVNVASTAPASVTNTATVSGGGETNTANNTAADITAINVAGVPDLTLTKTHTGNFAQSQTGAAYTVTVRNLGTGATSGLVTVVDTLPAGLTATAVSGTGWSCTLASLTCTRSDALAAGASYPAVTVTVNVATTAPASVTNTATVSGGGDVNGANNSASDPTTITAASSGLVAAYAFNEGTGATLTDMSGNGNTGTITNAAWTTGGKYGNALVFNGTTSRVTIADRAALHLSTGMTLEAWVRPSVAPSGWRDLIYKGDDIYFLEASGNTGTPVAAGTFGTALAQANAPTALVVNTWTHLAATYDGTAVRLYVNGVQAASTVRTGTLASSTSPLELGGDLFYGQVFDGAIDEVRIYNIALSAAQIQTDMNTPVSPPAPDTQSPTTPGALVALAIGGTEIDLTWTASTDNVGVTGYHIERCATAGCSAFAEIATTTTPVTTFSDTTVVANTSYTYRVRANDAAGNLSGFSNTATAVTPAPDTELPSAPGALTAAPISGTQIDVAWGAATDNVGVVGYRLERCQGAGCSAFTKLGTTITGTSFSDSGLSVNTSYSYIVRAQDAAGNLGPYSNVASATTLSTNPNLVAAYSFDEGVGTTVTDLTGNGHNGTIASAAWTASGKFGKALSFNGNNSLVTIPDAAALRLTTGMTLEAWVNPAVINTGWRDIVYKGNDNYYLEASSSNGLPVIGITVGSTGTEAYGAAPLPANTWTFLAATYDGANLKLFINGTQLASLPRTGSIITSSNPLQIGGDSIWGQVFNGLIDEVRVYNVALSPAQIQADMATAVNGGSAVLSLSPASLDFGSQVVGSASTPRTVTLTNGGLLALTVTSITTSGNQALEFTQTSNCIGTIAPLGSCAINVTFTPGAGGTRNATLVIADNAPGNPHSLALTGVGTGFSVSPVTSVLTTSQTQQFTVSGAGTSGVTWFVDNVAGGTSASGTVTSTGVYTPPGTAGTHNVTVTTTDGQKSATAAVYIVTSAGMYTHHNDNARTGQNLNETVLSLSKVNASSFGKLATATTDGIAHASPLYVANVNIPGVGFRNVVYVATEHDSVYAFDADARNSTPLWQRSFINPAAGITSVPNGDTGECCDIMPEIGITGTPVIDPVTNTLYVVVKTKEVSGSTASYPQRLHALDIATGAEKFGGPVVIQATVPGAGAGSVNGQLQFDSFRENQRTALLLYNGVVYFGFGSHGDIQPYHGWLLGYNATTLQRVLAFSTTPNGEGGGIWQSGGGLAIDAAGNFFFATGDGSYSVNSGGVDYGDTFLKFNPSTGVIDYFTPHDQSNLDLNNLDLDAGGMILLPDQPGAHPHVMVSAGKNGSIYVVDRDNLTHYHPTDQNVQTIANAFPFGTPLPGNYSSPVYFNGSVYFGPVSDVVQAFRLTNGLLSTTPSSTTPQAFPYPGGSLAISANGTSNGILWAVQKNGSARGTLHAYDAGNLASELYNSDQAGTRDTLDAPAAKFSIPLVINGRVYVASEGKLTIYGLLP